MRKIWKWILRNNEFTAVLALIAVIWYAMPPLLRLIDPQAGEFGVEVIYVPLIAGLFFLVGILFVWFYIKLVFREGFKILDDLFINTKSLSEWEKRQLLLRYFGWLIVLYSISLLAVTGLSAIL